MSVGEDRPSAAGAAGTANSSETPPVEVPAADDRAIPVGRATVAAMAVYHLVATTVTHYHKLAGAGVLLVGLAIFARPLGRLLGRYLVGTWKQLNAEAAAERAAEPPDRFDPRPLVVLATAAVALTMIEYFGHRNTFQQLVSAHAKDLTKHPHFALMGYIYWSLFRLVGYVIFPWLVILFMRGERIRDYGLSFKGFLEHLWVYAVLYLVVLPPVVMVSFTAPFQRTYPFYKLAARSWADFFAWELFYGLQFFALEVFFRGFMLHPLKKALGSYAIFVMAVPYCMIHYNKPLAEVLGAIVAGVVLGTLSLKTRSIWCGVLIHVSVAVTMDGLAVFHTAGFPGNPRFVGR